MVKRRISAINAINAVLRDQNDQDNLLEENDQDEVTIQNVNALKFKLKQLKRKKHAVMESIDDNNKLLQYIGELKLKLRLSDGTKILVTPDKIEGVDSTLSYLKSEKIVLNNQIEETKQLIRRNEQAVKEKYENKDAHFTIPKAFNLDKNNAMLKYLQGQKDDFAILQFVEEAYL